MNKVIFLLTFGVLGALASPIFGQGEPDAGYPAVSSWLKEQKIVLDTDPEKAAIEKAWLNNIRSVFIQHGIPSSEYVSVLNDVFVDLYKNRPEPSQTRTRAVWGAQFLLLKHLSLLAYRPTKPLNDALLPTVDQWLKENRIEIRGASGDAPWELAILHNLRILALVHNFPQESYRAMLNDCFLPVLKEHKSGGSRIALLRTIHFSLIMTNDKVTPKEARTEKK